MSTESYSKETVEILTELASMKAIQDNMHSKIDEIHKQNSAQWSRIDENGKSGQENKTQIARLDERFSMVTKLIIFFGPVAGGLVAGAFTKYFPL